MQLCDDDEARPVGEALTLRSLFCGLPAVEVEKLTPVRTEILVALNNRPVTAATGCDEIEQTDLKEILLERPDLCFRLAMALSRLYIDSGKKIGQQVQR